MHGADGLPERREIALIKDGFDELLGGVDVVGEGGGGGCYGRLFRGCGVEIHGVGAFMGWGWSRIFRGFVLVSRGLCGFAFQSNRGAAKTRGDVVSEEDDLMVGTKQAETAGVAGPDSRAISLVPCLGIRRRKNTTYSGGKHVRHRFPWKRHRRAGCKGRDPAVVVAWDEDEGGGLEEGGEVGKSRGQGIKVFFILNAAAAAAPRHDGLLREVASEDEGQGRGALRLGGVEGEDLAQGLKGTGLVEVDFAEDDDAIAGVGVFLRGGAEEVLFKSTHLSPYGSFAADA